MPGSYFSSAQTPDSPNETGKVERMKVALMATCIKDTMFPGVGRAVVTLLERLGVDVDFPQAPDLLRAVDGQHGLSGRGDRAGASSKLLPRSSTGERMNPYTSTWSGPNQGDGPQEMHVVLLDNGPRRWGDRRCDASRARRVSTFARCTSGSAGMRTGRCTRARSARYSTRCSVFSDRVDVHVMPTAPTVAAPWL